jgi:hypothetical protein
MTVVNGGYPAMYDEALATLVSRNIDYLARAKLVVVVIDDYFGIQSSSRPSPQSRDGESGLLDAAQAFLPMLDDALDGYVAGIELRSQLYWTARNLRESLRLTKTASLWDLSETGRWSWPPIDQPRFAELPEYVAKSRALVDQYMSGKFSQRSVDIFEDTIARLTSRGIPVVAFDLPPALPYVEYRDLHYGPIASQRATAFQAIFARHGVTVLRCATSSACQLDESIYADPIHFNADGARRMSRAFAAILRDSGALNLSESP